ncbi:LysR family transcriptional regulator [Streptomyces halobius]|uniref:LysR family transcriptional regulator n=1 Tax=Streptomyces halobius TaxID=2879846 RepID=A0ABY4MIS9_9ACTN|nr:LysR family transcriptional regulator [Streptomyces halobius]UQA97701.1 LysR family transcriptional regulator [Streptomyces halobius]
MTLTPDSAALLLSPRLAQFVAVARAQHVTRAAAELGVPQPTLSRTIARLEADLGVQLLSRHGRSVRLTSSGRALLAHAERALAHAERGGRAVQEDADPDSGRIAFGFPHTLGPSTVPDLLREFSERHPRIRFQLMQDYGAALLSRLRTGELALTLISPPPVEPDVTARRVHRQRLRLVVPAGHPLAGRRRARLTEVRDDAFVSLPSGYGLRQITDRLCATAGFIPRIAFEGEEVETIRGLVAAGLGVALLPAPAVPRPGVVELTVDGPGAVRDIALIWMTGRQEPPPVSAFRNFLLARRDRLLRD